MISSIISRLVILVFGTLYPAYASYKAVRTKNLKEYVKWMMYWIVFALFSCTETFTDVFLSWFPFYYEVKIVLVLWLLSPATKGSSILYRKFVHPALCRREQEIDEYIAKAKDQGYHTVLNLGTKGVNYATTVIMQTAIKGGGGLVQQLRKSYSLSDLSECAPLEGGAGAGAGVLGAHDEADDVLAEPRLIRRASAKSGYNTRRSASESNNRSPMYFPEVDVDVRSTRSSRSDEPDFSHVMSSEDISSGYSSADTCSAPTSRTRGAPCPTATPPAPAALRVGPRPRAALTSLRRPPAAEDSEVITEELHDDDNFEYSNMPPLLNVPSPLFLSHTNPPFIYQCVGDQIKIVQVLADFDTNIQIISDPTNRHNERISITKGDDRFEDVSSPIIEMPINILTKENIPLESYNKDNDKIKCEDGPNKDEDLDKTLPNTSTKSDDSTILFTSDEDQLVEINCNVNAASIIKSDDMFYATSVDTILLNNNNLDKTENESDNYKFASTSDKDQLDELKCNENAEPASIIKSDVFDAASIDTTPLNNNNLDKTLNKPTKSDNFKIVSTSDKEQLDEIKYNENTDPASILKSDYVFDATSIDTTSLNDNYSTESDDEASFGTPDDSPKSRRKSPKIGKYGKGKAPLPPTKLFENDGANKVEDNLTNIINSLPDSVFKESASTSKTLCVVNPITEKKLRHKSKSPVRVPKSNNSKIGKLLQLPGKLAFWHKNDERSKSEVSVSSDENSRRSSTVEKPIDDFESCLDLEAVITNTDNNEGDKQTNATSDNLKEAVELESEIVSQDIIDKSDELNKLIKAKLESHPEYKYVSLHDEEIPTSSKSTDV